MRLPVIVLAVCLLLVPRASLGEEVLLRDWDTFTPPVLMNSERPRIPGAMHAQDVEGWVDVVVTVDTEGKAHNPRLVDTSIPGIFNDATLQAVDSWRFEPATVNGRPVEGTYEGRQIFRFKDNRDAVSQAFFRRARGISRALAKDDLDEAMEKIEKLEKKRQRLLAEGVYLDLFRATYHEKSGNPEQALGHLNQALYVADDFVARSVREHLLRAAVTMNADQRHYVSALSRYDELEDLLGKLPADDAARMKIAEVKSIIAGREPLAWDATLALCESCEPESYTWSQPLVRERFTFRDLPDSLEETQLRCGNRFRYFRPRSGETYQIPDPAAACTFYTKSWQPVSFRLIELPPAKPAEELRLVRR